ncbi:DgyrCDS5002 [Dimorphilus gyrociliatus]|uniref:DgyrCDS5002 n=1 Tax=Dimorphilus gyrociliatus TaxID=2664684 RepID=A0A7I8VII1_9ANNE|nr:DgyrCDS5002 [Dimorphilus gyrociliatus]
MNNCLNFLLVLLSFSRVNCIELSTDKSNLPMDNSSLKEKKYGVRTTPTPTDFKNIDPSVSLWGPVIAIIIVTMLIVFLLMIFKQCSGQQSGEGAAVQLNINVECRSERGRAAQLVPGQPTTPPPSYTAVEREVSFISDISQTESMIDEPPEYETILSGGKPTRVLRKSLLRSSSDATTSKPRSAVTVRRTESECIPLRKKPAEEEDEYRMATRLRDQSIQEETDPEYENLPPMKVVPKRPSKDT